MSSSPLGLGFLTWGEGMSKKSTRAKKEEKARRAQEVRRAKLLRRLPWYIVGVAGVGLISAFLFIGVSSGGGGGGSSASAAFPAGYEPPAIGEQDAPVEFVLWEDFQCPFCGRFNLQTLPQLRQQYVDTGKVKFVWRNFVNYGTESQDAAVAAYCAGEQEMFWEYHDTLFRNQSGVNQGAFSKNNLKGFADELGLERAAFDTCLDGVSFDAVVAADKQLGRGEFKVNGTPTFFINGLRVVGAQPTADFVSIIEDALSRSAQ